MDGRRDGGIYHPGTIRHLTALGTPTSCPLSGVHVISAAVSSVSRREEAEPWALVLKTLLREASWALLLPSSLFTFDR